MAKTQPQLVKIERADPERVSENIEPYPWQRKGDKPKTDPNADPFMVPTIRQPKVDKKK